MADRLVSRERFVSSCERFVLRTKHTHSSCEHNLWVSMSTLQHFPQKKNGTNTRLMHVHTISARLHTVIKYPRSIRPAMMLAMTVATMNMTARRMPATISTIAAIMATTTVTTNMNTAATQLAMKAIIPASAPGIASIKRSRAFPCGVPPPPPPTSTALVKRPERYHHMKLKPQDTTRYAFPPK